MRNLPRKAGDPAMDATYRRTRAPVVIECEAGYCAGGWISDYNGKRIRQFKEDGGGAHHANFIKAVRSRKAADLNADILQGHLSSALCHMGNISYRLGREMPRDDAVQLLKSNAVLLDAFARFRKHLAANGVDFESSPGAMGPWLTIDPDTERFTGDLASAANAYLWRDYRPPFVVPEKV
jgi:hypothetical protein